MKDEKIEEPAFPVNYQHKVDFGEASIEQRWNGMSLREWYAGQALIGYAEHFRSSVKDEESYKECAKRCFKMADSMLVERSIWLKSKNENA